ncbi:MAG: response regulator transcription factor [Solirubrobacteraceae bacterium]
MAKSRSSASILVVDDEPSITESVAMTLRFEGFDVATAATAGDALAMMSESPFDLLILDVMLPDINGLELTRRIRHGGLDIPVLFLTARSAVQDRVAGLSVGGDDYVTKPFSLVEVVARVHAILRRRHPSPADHTLRFADLVMDEDSHQVWRGDTPVNLTATEFNLLRLFLLNPRKVLSKGEIMDHVWRYDFGGNPNIVETYIGYVRKKINALGPPLIQTIRLVGYVLRESP